MYPCLAIVSWQAAGGSYYLWPSMESGIFGFLTKNWIMLKKITICLKLDEIAKTNHSVPQFMQNMLMIMILL